MDSQSFCFWLNGFVELTDGQYPSESQWDMIVEHLKLSFKKVTPPLEIGQSWVTDISRHVHPYTPGKEFTTIC